MEGTVAGATPHVDPAPQDCLGATSLVDSEHPAVVAWGRQHAGAGADQERAVALYYAVRDGFRYDPYRMPLDRVFDIEQGPAGFEGCGAIAWLALQAEQTHSVAARWTEGLMMFRGFRLDNAYYAKRAGGHAVGIKAPGGTVIRTDTTGSAVE